MFELILFTLFCNIFKKIKSKKLLKQIGKETKRKNISSRPAAARDPSMQVHHPYGDQETSDSCKFSVVPSMHLAKHSSQRMNDTICLAPCPPLFFNPTSNTRETVGCESLWKEDIQRKPVYGTNELIHKTEIVTDVANKLMVTKGVRGGG